MFDVLTIAAVADELGETLLDGRVQRIGLLDPLSFAAEIYAGGRRRMLVASADNQRARLLITAAAPSFDPALITPFGLLLRKYVRGGVIVAVEQPPLERLVRISIAKRLTPNNAPRPRAAEARDDLLVPDDEPEDAPPDDDADADGEFEATYVHLAVELMGRHSNLILIDDDGRVMESAKRVTPSMSRVRPILPKTPYRLPPPIEKPDPRQLTAVAAGRLLAEEQPGAALAPALVRRLRAISPQMGREIAHRAAGDAAAKVGGMGADGAAAVARETRALFEPLLTSAWAPRVYAGDDGAIVAFAPVPMVHLAATYQETAVPTVSAAAERTDAAAGPGTPTDHAQRKERLAAAIRDARDRLQGRLASLRAEGAKAGEIERLRERGELIYAYLWRIQPGDTHLDVDGVSVPLDPALSAKENAKEYFERYRKAQGAGANVPALVERTEHEVAYLDQLLQLTAQASGFAEVEALAAEWAAHRGPGGPGADAPSKAGKPGKKQAARRPKALLDGRGNAVYVGHSGRENDLVTFDLAGPDDTWLHARGVPGSHVVVRWRLAESQDPRTLEAAAALAAHYSAARGSATVEVDAAPRRHVRKIKGAGPGMVTYRNERTLAVRPGDEAAVGGVLG